MSAEPPHRVARPDNIFVAPEGARDGSSSVPPSESAPFVCNSDASDTSDDPDAPRSPPPIAWSIAGHDPSSGAGFTADQLTFAAHGLFAATVATALTAQSTLGVVAVEVIRPEFLRLTLETLLADLPPAGVKIGMLGSLEAAQVVAEFLSHLRPAESSAQPVPIVLDPVLISSSGHSLLPPEAIQHLHEHLLPQVAFITPNYAELAVLTGMPVASAVEAREAGDALGRRHPQLGIIVTGGDRDQPTDLLRLPNGTWTGFPGEHIESTSTHGTGCAFSSALLANLVLGQAPAPAVATAKLFVREGIRHAQGIGHGKGPLDLLWPLK